jgi:hypothetical protein
LVDTTTGARFPATGLSPWQNPCVERVIGSIRRECLDHVIILNQRHLRRMLRAYLAYLPSKPHTSRAEQRRSGRQAGACRFRPDHRLA